MIITCNIVIGMLSSFLKFRIWCSHVKIGIWFHMWTFLIFTCDVFVYDVHIWCSHMMLRYMMFTYDITYEVWYMISHVNLAEDHIRFSHEMIFFLCAFAFFFFLTTFFFGFLDCLFLSLLLSKLHLLSATDIFVLIGQSSQKLRLLCPTSVTIRISVDVWPIGILWTRAGILVRNFMCRSNPHDKTASATCLEQIHVQHWDRVDVWWRWGWWWDRVDVWW